EQAPRGQPDLRAVHHRPPPCVGTTRNPTLDNAPTRHRAWPGADGGISKVRKLIESTHVSLGGEIGAPQAWALPYLSDEHHAYARNLLFSADALLLGRRTYEGLSAAYIKMAGETTDVPNDFIQRMNSIPKYVA